MNATCESYCILTEKTFSACELCFYCLAGEQEGFRTLLRGAGTARPGHFMGRSLMRPFGTKEIGGQWRHSIHSGFDTWRKHNVSTHIKLRRDVVWSWQWRYVYVFFSAGIPCKHTTRWRNHDVERVFNVIIAPTSRDVSTWYPIGLSFVTGYKLYLAQGHVLRLFGINSESQDQLIVWQICCRIWLFWIVRCVYILRMINDKKKYWCHLEASNASPG